MRQRPQVTMASIKVGRECPRRSPLAVPQHGGRPMRGQARTQCAAPSSRSRKVERIHALASRPPLVCGSGAFHLISSSALLSPFLDSQTLSFPWHHPAACFDSILPARSETTDGMIGGGEAKTRERGAALYAKYALWDGRNARECHFFHVWALSLRS